MMIGESHIYEILKEEGNIRTFTIYLKNGRHYAFYRTDETGSRDCPMCPLYDRIDFVRKLLYIKKDKKEIYIDMNEISDIEVTRYHNTEEEE